MFAASLELFYLQWIAAPLAALAAPGAAMSALNKADTPAGAAGAVEREASVNIPASADIVYQLLDPASPGNRHIRQGSRIEPAGGDGRWRLVDRRIPEQPFLLTIVTQLPYAAISIHGVSEVGASIGAYLESTSHYEIEPRPEGGVRVRVREVSVPRVDLSPTELRWHERMMRFGMRMDLLRLKIDAAALA